MYIIVCCSTAPSTRVTTIHYPLSLSIAVIVVVSMSTIHPSLSSSLQSMPFTQDSSSTPTYTLSTQLKRARKRAANELSHRMSDDDCQLREHHLHSVTINNHRMDRISRWHINPPPLHDERRDPKKGRASSPPTIPRACDVGCLLPSPSPLSSIGKGSCRLCLTRLMGGLTMRSTIYTYIVDYRQS
jgi:hypothetical protein